MIALDTNVLVRFLVVDDKAQSAKAARLVDRAVARNETQIITLSSGKPVVIAARRATVIVLLAFLIRYCQWLLNNPGVRFKDSAVGPHPAAGSWILLESADVQIHLCNEKNLITLEIRSLHDPKRKNWFSFDLLVRLLGHEVATGAMDDANSELLSTHIEEMIMLFDKKQVTATLAKLNALKAERARRI